MSTPPPSGAYVTPQLDDGKVITDGTASAEQLRALLGETLSGVSAAASAAQSAAESAAASAEQTSPVTVARSLRKLSPSKVIAGVGAFYELPGSSSAQLVEWLGCSWFPTSAPVAFGKLILAVFVGPAGSEMDSTGSPPAEWIAVDGAFVDPAPPGGPGPLVVIDRAAPIYVPPGSVLIVQTIPQPYTMTAQWAEVPG